VFTFVRRSFPVIFVAFIVLAQPVSGQATLPTVTLTAPSAIAATTATAGGNVTAAGSAAVTARGVVWSTSANPTTADAKTVDGSGTGSFVSKLTGLGRATTYHIRAYATSTAGTGYSKDVSFTTKAVVPAVKTTAIGAVEATTATSGGTVSDNGGAAVTARGVVWATHAAPTLADSKTTDGSGNGTYSSALTGLTRTTLYHVRAYATNSSGTGYGGELTFTTKAALPTVTLTVPSAITATTATAGGNVTAAGGAAVTARGVVWSTSANPTTAATKTVDGSGTGSFVSKLTGLVRATTYHIRAYATSTAGTGYSKDVSFTTKTVVPTVKTTAIGAVEATTATSGGTVSDNGGAAVTARGVIWATHAAPTLADSKTTDGSGNGTYSSALTGLTRTTLYHVRAYATNSSGTGYGSELTFTTKALLPMLITEPVTGITTTSAVSGGQVTSDGGSTVKARGVVWSTHINPTTADSKTVDSLSSDVYTSNIGKLAPGGEYHVRAYATNAAGTGYGGDILFTAASPTGAPTVTTAAAKLASTSTATAGGNVTNANGKAITERGIVWAIDKLPTLADNKLKATGTTGAFTVTLTGLKAKTAYYIRAYATNAAGTGYGSAAMVATLNGYGLPAAVSPLISNRWLDYTWPYNAYYPKLNGQQGQAACVPTALAKMLGYWKQPNGQGALNGTDAAGYHWSINLAAMNIDFTKVYDELSPDATKAQYDQTAKIFLAAGAMAALHDVGGANISTDLYDELGYWAKLTPAVHIVHDWEYTAEDWKHLVEYELAHGRPIMVSGGIFTDNDPWVGGGVTGHMWNVDGYDDQDRVHATYNYVDSSSTPIAGYFPVYAMGPVTNDGGQWPGYTHDHYALMNFQPALSATSNPVVETEPADNPTLTTARLRGSVIGKGNATLTKRGFHITAISGASVKPYDVIVGSGEGYFIKTLTDLEPATTYQVKAFATTSTKSYYGEAQQFTTLDAGAVPAEVMPLIDSGWVFNTWPYNAALPAFQWGPNGYFYNEPNANALARLLYYWRYPANGSGVFSNYVSWAGITLDVDLSTLNLDYTKMPYKLKSADSAATYKELAKLEAATEIFGFGATGTGAGAMRVNDLDSTTATLLASAWDLDSGLRMVKQEAVSASDWAALLKAEIAAGRPVLVQGRTSDSVAPGKSGNVNAGWFLVDGYNAKGQFHADYSPVGMGGAPIAQGWYSPASLGPSGGFITFNRAFIGFKPKE
jgi:hypothetical protein